MRQSSSGMRVVVVLDWFIYYIASIANALVAEGAEVIVVTRDRGDELGNPVDPVSAKRALLDPRVRLEIVRGRQSQPIIGLSEVRRIGRMVRAFRPDVIHTQAHKDWRLYAIAKSSPTSVPKLLTLHDVEDHPGSNHNRNRVQRAVEQRLRRRSDGLIVHGDDLRVTLSAMPWYRTEMPIVVIPVGSLAQPSSPTPLPVDKAVLFFGRVEYYKGLDVLVDAVKMLPTSDESLRVIVAGTGSEFERCRLAAGDDRRFDWREGFVADEALPGLFAESSFVVLPYREASQSGVIPLASANRRAVVASAVGALPESVIDGVTGLLVPPEDPVALAAALTSLLADTETLERMSDAALEDVTSGPKSAQSIARAHLAAYHQALASSRRGDSRER